MTERPDVWVTRAQPHADATARRVRERGRLPLVAPLLEVRALGAPLDLAGAGALAFTSVNGVGAFVARSGERDLPVFAVGDTTAATARSAGFTKVESASGDVAALAELIAARRDQFEGEVLSPGAAEPAGDLPGLLAARGVSARQAPIYETTPLPPSDEAARAWSDLEAVLLHSGKAARTFLSATAAWPSRDLRVLCMSDAVAAPLRDVYPRVMVAAHPAEDALLNLLDVTGP